MGRKMTIPELDLCLAMKRRQITTVDATFNVLGYLGSFTEPFDDRLFKDGDEQYKEVIIKLFEILPKLKAVFVNYIPSTHSTEVILQGDKPLSTEAIRKDLVCTCVDNNKVVTPESKLREPDMAVVTFEGELDIYDIADMFGIKSEIEDTRFYSSDDDEENIEIDIDNPLDIDFPDPEDK